MRLPQFDVLAVTLTAAVLAPGPEGALCASNADCVGDGVLLCAPSEDGHQRCAPRREKGETCTSDAVCGTWVCNRAYDPPRCADDGRPGDPCSRPEECFYADVCNTALDPPQCASYAIEGEPCADDDHCAEWLVCDTQSAEPRCVPR